MAQYEIKLCSVACFSLTIMWIHNIAISDFSSSYSIC